MTFSKCERLASDPAVGCACVWAREYSCGLSPQEWPSRWVSGCRVPGNALRVCSHKDPVPIGWPRPILCDLSLLSTSCLSISQSKIAGTECRTECVRMRSLLGSGSISSLGEQGKLCCGVKMIVVEMILLLGHDGRGGPPVAPSSTPPSPFLVLVHPFKTFCPRTPR